MRIIVALGLCLMASFVSAKTPANLFDENFKSAVEQRDKQSWKGCKNFPPNPGRHPNSHA